MPCLVSCQARFSFITGGFHGPKFSSGRLEICRSGGQGLWAFFVAFKTKFVHPFIRQFSRSVIRSLARVSRNSCSGVVVFWFDMAESVGMSGLRIFVATKDWEKGSSNATIIA